VREVADALDLAPDTVRRWAQRRGRDDLLPSLIRGGRYLYLLADVRLWLEDGTLGRRS
jgi:hypothetical protein